MKPVFKLLGGTWECPSCHAKMAWVLTKCSNCSRDRKNDLKQMIESVDALIEIIDAAMVDRDSLHKTIDKVREDNFHLRVECEELHRSVEEAKMLRALDACLERSKKSKE
jgi:transcription elongation factor Elf1